MCFCGEPSYTQAGLESDAGFRGGLVFKAHRLFVSLNSRLESNAEEEEGGLDRDTVTC